MVAWSSVSFAVPRRLGADGFLVRRFAAEIGARLQVLVALDLAARVAHMQRLERLALGNGRRRRSASESAHYERGDEPRDAEPDQKLEREDGPTKRSWPTLAEPGVAMSFTEGRVHIFYGMNAS
jgi:hypothetical protein